MTKRTKISECPDRIADLIRLSNAWDVFNKAKPADKLAMRTAYLLVYNSLPQTSGDERTKMQLAAQMLPEAITVRQDLSRHGIDSSPNEVVRILQWKLTQDTAIPWPAEEFDRRNQLLKFEGFTSERLKLCAVCDRIFWARRIATEYCERQRCLDTYKKRKAREKQRGKI